MQCASGTIALALAAGAFAICLAQAGAARAQMITPAKQELHEEQQRAAGQRLYALGYPADESLAVARWRADAGSRSIGPLTPEEAAVVLEQPDPPHFAAFAGNPFQGMGIAVRHKTRADAEAHAVALCRRQGGGSACAAVNVVPGGKCVAVHGYLAGPGVRRGSRGSYVVAPTMEIARVRSLEHCRTGAGPSAARLCKPMLAFCADGTRMERLGAPVPSSSVSTP
jgi:hypothetical protein